MRSENWCVVGGWSHLSMMNEGDEQAKNQLAAG